MTRKQALENAVKALENDPVHKETASVLLEIAEEMPLIGWTDKTIRDAVEQFIADNGYIPSTKDFGKKPLPPHTVIKNRYNMTCGEWLKLNYSQKKSSQDREYKIKKFIEEYNRIQPNSAREYNEFRSKNIPCWNTICKLCGVTRWQELIGHLGLASRRTELGVNAGREVSVIIHSDYDYSGVD